MPVAVAMVGIRGDVRESEWATRVTLRFLATIRWHEALAQGTDLAFASVMAPLSVVFPAPRVDGRGRAKDAEGDRHDQGRLSVLEHCLVSEQLSHSG
jgi:hypothetical protein